MAEAVLSRRSVVKNEYELLADITVSSATTNIDITGLNIGKDEEIVLVGYFGDAGFGIGGYITVNGNNTLTNYYSQYIYALETSVVGKRDNNPLFFVRKSEIIAKIKLTNSGYFVWQSSMIPNFVDNAPLLEEVYGTSTFTITNITSIRLFSNLANGISADSRIQLYKVAK